jgi:hypothetical protein
MADLRRDDRKTLWRGRCSYCGKPRAQIVRDRCVPYVFCCRDCDTLRTRGRFEQWEVQSDGSVDNG